MFTVKLHVLYSWLSHTKQEEEIDKQTLGKGVNRKHLKLYNKAKIPSLKYPDIDNQREGQDRV
jgi:hypothetical protein